MQTYKYNAETKEYLYAEEAFLDPLETEKAGKPVYLLPADSTFAEPLTAKEGFAVCWNGTTWEYKEDHRGKRYWMAGAGWDTQPQEMKELGKLPEGAMLKAPEKPAEVVAKEELAKAKSERAAAVAALTVEVDGMVFDGDEKAQERMARAVLMAESPEESMEWVLADSSVAIVTAEQLRRACRAAGKAMGVLWVKPYQN